MGKARRLRKLDKDCQISGAGLRRGRLRRRDAVCRPDHAICQFVNGTTEKTAAGPGAPAPGPGAPVPGPGAPGERRRRGEDKRKIAPHED